LQVAPHEPTPSVAYNGGPVLSSPQLFTVTYQNDVNTQLYQQFVEWIAGSQWYATIGAVYGVSNGTATTAVIPQDAPAALQDSDVQNLIVALIDAGIVPPPVVPDGGNVPNLLYMMYFPYGTTISGQNLGVSCQSFGAYHAEVINPSNLPSFAYAVMPTCDPNNPYYTEVSASHELAEASSDPLVYTAPGYTNGGINNGWIGEIGDICTPFDIGYQLDGGTYYVVQRIWSNSAADAGLQPCVPAPNLPYAGVSPQFGNDVSQYCDPNNPQVCTSFLLVKAGQSFDFSITSWVSAPSVAPAVAAIPYAVTGLIPATFAPNVTQDAYNLHNGEVGHLSVSIPAGTPSMSLGAFTLLSGFDNDSYGYWPVIVFVQ
jgi:hypothetical protein